MQNPYLKYSCLRLSGNVLCVLLSFLSKLTKLHITNKKHTYVVVVFCV